MSPAIFTVCRRAARGLLFAACPCIALSATPAGDLRNFGNDPFLHISSAVNNCPTPLGPALSEADWLADAHHRIEKGNHCWLEGRCRLSNSYAYDREIADALPRRLTAIAAEIPWQRQSALWLTVQRRIVVVQGCVAPTFPLRKFLKALGETADVEAVIDQTVVRPGSHPLTYPTPEHPELPAGSRPLP